jgi:hypothetical protein
VNADLMRCIVVRRRLRRVGRVRLLAELAGELAALGLCVSIGDARPGLYVRTGRMVPVLCVTVDVSGAFFEWRGAYNRHAADDPAGAARQILAYINARGSRRSGRPS